MMQQRRVPWFPDLWRVLGQIATLQMFSLFRVAARSAGFQITCGGEMSETPKIEFPEEPRPASGVVGVRREGTASRTGLCSILRAYVQPLTVQPPMPSTEDADQVLREHTTPKACYPCAKRKVKCGSQRPCSTCVARGHPAICMVGPSGAPYQRNVQRRQARRTRPSGSPSPHGSSSQSQAVLPNVAAVVQADARAEMPDPPADSYLGGNAAPSLLRGLPDTASKDLIRPALGLANSLSSYPFTWTHRADEASKVLKHLIPTHADILRYSKSLRRSFAC